MNLSCKQTAWTAGLLVLSALNGWWAGTSSGSAVFSPVPAQEAAKTRGVVSGRESEEPLIPADGDAASDGLSDEEASAVQKELTDLLSNPDMDELMSDPDPLFGFRMLARLSCLFAKLSKEKQEEVMGVVPEEERGEAAAMIQMFSAMMPDTKPKTGSDFAKELGTAKSGFERMPAMVKWASADAPAFLNYWKTEIAKPDAPKWLREEMGTVFSEIGSMDPELLMREAMAMKDPELRKTLLKAVWPRQFYTGGKSEWTAEKDNLLKFLLTEKPDQREDSLSGVISTRMEHESVEEARTWVASLELGPESKEWTEKALFEAWRGKDRLAAAKWMLEQSLPEQRADRIAEFVSRWTDANVAKDLKRMAPEPDIAGCADWILSLGIGPDTEKAISVLADGWIEAGEPAAALAWARAIPDAVARAACLEKVTTQIGRRYPDTWRAMLTAAGLPAGE